MISKHRFTYSISQLLPYVNWLYFYHAWQVGDKVEQARLKAEAIALMEQAEGRYAAHSLLWLGHAGSDGDDIVLEDGTRLPTLRQQLPSNDGLCWALADYIAPTDRRQPDTIGVFATTVDAAMVADRTGDTYMHMMMQLIADRLAEAAAERLHQQVRTELWGYAPQEHLTPEQLHACQYVGIRPAVGYPSLPDTSVNFIIDSVLHMSQIGIRLTENGAMRPHASVSGLMIGNPRARYFTVGPIGADQLEDYARRRGLPTEMVRKFVEHVTS